MAFEETLSGLAAFNSQFNPTKLLVIGDQGIMIDAFLRQPVAYWFQADV